MLSSSHLCFVPGTHNYAKAYKGHLHTENTQRHTWLKHLKTRYPQKFKHTTKSKPHHMCTHVSQSRGIYKSCVHQGSPRIGYDCWLHCSSPPTNECNLTEHLKNSTRVNHPPTHKAQLKVIMLVCWCHEAKMFWETSFVIQAKSTDNVPHTNLWESIVY